MLVKEGLVMSEIIHYKNQFEESGSMGRFIILFVLLICLFCLSGFDIALSKLESIFD